MARVHECFIDPGRSTGIVWYHYSDTEPWTRDGYAQVTGGLTGLLIWLNEWLDYLNVVPGVKFYAEKFKPLTMPGFSQTLDSTYPLVVEGGLVTLGLLPEYEPGSERWQFASDQYWVGGKNKDEKRRKQKDFLREHDLYLTGKDVGGKAGGHTDAEDAISATFHALSRMRKLRHGPTLKEFWGDSED